MRFLKQGRFASLRQAQLELTPFDAGRLQSVALRLRELYPAADRSRLEARVSTAFIERLVAEVTKGFKGDVGVVPRQFLREFVTQMDLVDENDDYDPMSEYGFEPIQMSPAEEEAIRGSDSAATASEEEDGLVPQEDVWRAYSPSLPRGSSRPLSPDWGGPACGPFRKRLGTPCWAEKTRSFWRRPPVARPKHPCFPRSPA